MHVRLTTTLIAAAVGLGVVAGGFETASAEDAPAVIAKRQESMKGQGKALGVVRGYLEGKAELPAAQTAADTLITDLAMIPSLFPEKTGMAEFPDKSSAKPEIWTQGAKFSADAKAALAKAEALKTALKGGDKAAITTAFDAMIKGGIWDAGNACGQCHTTFRERKKT